MRTEAQELSLRSSFLLASMICLSIAHWHAEWRADDTAFAMAAITFLLLTAATACDGAGPLAALLERLALPALAGITAYSFYNLWTLAPADTRYSAWLIVAASLAGVGLVRNPAFERWRIPMFLATYVWLGIWRIQTTPSPHIDVWAWHQEALKTLLHGHNPYAGSMPNIYDDAKFYDPSMVVNGRVLTGFQYPPVSLYFALPGQLLGDYRYSLLGAMVLAGACMAYARPNGFGAIAAGLWLCSPRALFILEHGWTEPMLVMLFAAFLFCITRGSKLAFVPLGLLIAGKQYMAIFVPLLWLLPLEDGKRNAHWLLLGRAVAFGGLVTLPFLVVNPKAFFECMVLLQLRQPFRIESLSLNAWWFIHNNLRLPDWLGFASVIPTTVLALLRGDRSPGGLAGAFAFVSFTFFGLSKQAFGNYYFFTMGVICCALAYASRNPFRART